MEGVPECFIHPYGKLQIYFFLSVKSKYYKDRKSSQEYIGREQKGAKKNQTRINPKTLPTPQPSEEVQNRVCVINTIQVSPSPQIGYKISFNPLGGGDLILEHQPISSTPKSPKQAQRCCHLYFFSLFTHNGSLPSEKGVKDRTQESPANPNN